MLSDSLPRHAALAGRDCNFRLADLLVQRERAHGSEQDSEVSGTGGGPDWTSSLDHAQGKQAEVLAALARLLVDLAAALERDFAARRDAIATLRVPMDSTQQRQAILEILKAHFPQTHRVDRKAVSRWLDEEAITDRFARQLQVQCQEVQHLAQVCAARAHAMDQQRYLRCISAALRERLCQGLLRLFNNKELPWYTRASLAELLAMYSVEPKGLSEQDARQAVLAKIHDMDDDPFVLVAALESHVPTLRERSHQHAVLRRVILPRQEIFERLPRDHIFVRARALRLAAELGFFDLCSAALAERETSAHVRLTALEMLASGSHGEAARGEPHELADPGAELDRWIVGARSASLQERKCVLVHLVSGARAWDERSRWPQRFAALLEVEAKDSGAALALACTVVVNKSRTLTIAHDDARRLRELWGPYLEEVMARALSEETRRAIARLLLCLEVHGSEELCGAYRLICAARADWREGTSKVFRQPVFCAMRPDELLVVLALCAADDFDFSATPLSTGYRIERGERRRLAPWRVLHEWRHPAPDKRQGFNHLTGSFGRGPLLATSDRLAEVTPTRVPGERVASAACLEWGAELPLPRTLFQATAAGNLTIHTGLQTLRIEREPTRMRGFVRASRAYVSLAAERERLRVSGATNREERYDYAMRDLGFTVHRQPGLGLHRATGAAQEPSSIDAHESREAHKPSDAGKVSLAILPWLPTSVWDFFSFQGNTPIEMLAFALTLLALFVARAVYLYTRARFARRSIPLSIGGWGSRGKSGTERLKAGLFHGLGYRVVAKTTGCEAMIIAGIPPKDAPEVFLFRPYDKATIWEQHQVLNMGARLGAQVFLWECMALKPDFVRILQHDWMTDDIATITNTYPDHEDIQGPAGRDVADVIAKFIPPKAQAFSSEQHMAPVLEQEARRIGTELQTCVPEEWELLPQDLLDRFPYFEHPRNIALVIRLAEALDIPRDLCLRMIADHVVPDLGVLREYGPLPFRTRTLSFINGMSANERAGFTSNWTRMDLAAIEDTSGLGEWLALVVNNRGDRPARSAAFVEITARDAAADAIFVIGTNVGAFGKEYRRVLGEELGGFFRDLAQKPAAERHASTMAECVRRLRRKPLPMERVRDLLHASMHGDAELAPDEALLAAVYDNPHRLEDALATLGSSPPPATNDGDKAQLLWRRKRWLLEACLLWHVQEKEGAISTDALQRILPSLLMTRFVTVDDPSIPGDALLQQVALDAPPGSRVRMLGCQNIKGTGLGFVYQWISADETARALEALRKSDRNGAAGLLAELRGRKNIGASEAEYITVTLEESTFRTRLSMMGLGSETDACIEHFAAMREAGRAKSPRASQKSSFLGHLKTRTEEALDFVDSVRRRRESDRLRKDLINQRIGRRRAAIIAQGIVARQKGGWLFS